MELRNVAKDEPQKVDTNITPVMRKICSSTEIKLKEKKRELHEVEKQLSELDMDIDHDPTPQGLLLQYRCNNCHIRGHKADNNKGSAVCHNEKCTDFRFCGQKDRHKEFKQEKKGYQNKIKHLKTEIADLDEELVRASAYESKSAHSFTRVVKDRLRKIDPVKYGKSSVLMRDLMILKSAYDNKIPTVGQNDKLEFRKLLNKFNSNVKAEDSSDSSCDSPPNKKMCAVTPQKIVQAQNQMHFSQYVPNMYSPVNIPQGPFFPCLPNQNAFFMPNYQQFYSSVEIPFYRPDMSVCQQQNYPPMTSQPTRFQAAANSYIKQEDDEDDDNTNESKPKIWSPIFM